MRKLKKSLILLSAICLSSCTIPEIDDQIQCSPDLHFILENGKRYVDEDLTTCRCRMYRRKPEYLGPVGSFWHEDISYCSKMIGEPADTYPIVFTFEESIRLEYIDFSSSKNWGKKK